MRLILVRHGQTQWNLARRVQGRLDSPLTAKGHRQAASAGRALAKHGIDTFFCSDTGRAVQTADQMIEANPTLPSYQLDSRLRELDYGRWEGMEIEAIKLRYYAQYQIFKNDPASFSSPGGESFAEMQSRFRHFMEEIDSDSPATCLVVSHSQLLHVAVTALLARRLNDLWELPRFPAACITIMNYRDKTWSWEQLPDTSHLSAADSGDG